MKYIFLFIYVVVSWNMLFAQSLTKEEQKLYDIIMKYRKSKRLVKIPLSKSLTFVAQTHVKDLTLNQPVSEKCNLHSWSSQGDWSACCYRDDHSEAACMWSKPREITKYQGNGYEISSWQSIGISAEDALSIWKESPSHNDVIINKGIWSDNQWKSIGIGIMGQYAVVWFGEEADPEK
jgi:uncharacterized protein YkwD